jgi:hypothetical protein
VSGDSENRRVQQAQYVLDKGGGEEAVSIPAKHHDEFIPVVKEMDKEEFRKKFQRTLRRCAQKGFSIEECFGIVWEETVEGTRLPESAQAELYEEMIHWARQYVR